MWNCSSLPPVDNFGKYNSARRRDVGWSNLVKLENSTEGQGVGFCRPLVGHQTWPTCCGGRTAGARAARGSHTRPSYWTGYNPPTPRKITPLSSQTNVFPPPLILFGSLAFTFSPCDLFSCRRVVHHFCSKTPLKCLALRQSLQRISPISRISVMSLVMGMHGFRGVSRSMPIPGLSAEDSRPVMASMASTCTIGSLWPAKPASTR